MYPDDGFRFVQRLPNGPSPILDDADINRQREGEIERQRSELGQLKERLALMCRQVCRRRRHPLPKQPEMTVTSCQVGEIEEQLTSARRELVRSEEANHKLQRDVKEVRLTSGSRGRTDEHILPILTEVCASLQAICLYV